MVYDGVVGPWFLPAFVEGVARQGLRLPGELHLAVLLPDLAVTVRRVAERTGHGFTDAAATARMHADFSAAAGDLPERHLLRDVTPGPEGVAALVREHWAAGELRVSL